MEIFANTLLLSKTKGIDKFVESKRKTFARLCSHIQVDQKFLLTLVFGVFIDVTTTLAPRLIDRPP